MSSEAIRAVRSQSTFNTADTWPEIQALLEIAEYANPEGVTGIAGDKRKCIGLNRLAQVAGVHRNSIMDVLERIKEAGELDWEKHGNWGRAIHYVFKIKLPIEPISANWNNSTISTTPIEGRVLILENQLAQLAQQISTISTQISNISTVISTISTMPPEAKVHDTYIDTYIDTKGDTRARVREELPPKTLDEFSEEENEIPFEIIGAADDDVKKAWYLSFDLVQCWCEEIARIKYPYLNGSPEKNGRVYDDYHIPASKLIYMVNFDMQRAAQLLRDKRADIIRDGLSVRRIEPAVKQIEEDFERLLFAPPEKQTAGLTPIRPGVY